MLILVFSVWHQFKFVTFSVKVTKGHVESKNKQEREREREREKRANKGRSIGRVNPPKINKN